MYHDQIVQSIRNFIASDSKLKGLSGEVNRARRQALKAIDSNPEKNWLMEAQLRARMGDNWRERLETTDTHEYTREARFFMDFINGEDPTGFYFSGKFDQELSLTAAEFAMNGILIPPFPFFIIHAKDFFSDLSIGCSKLDGKQMDKSFTAWCRYFPDTNHVIMVTFASVDDGKLPFASMCIRANLTSTQYDLIDITSDGRPEYADKNSKFSESGKLMVQSMLQCLMMLNHPVYEVETYEVDAAMNAKRARKGKTTFSRYIYVRMRPEIERALSEGGGGPRRPHWRRGHVRKLQDGRTVPVQAHLVNWKGDKSDPNAPKPKIYVAGGKHA